MEKTELSKLTSSHDLTLSRSHQWASDIISLESNKTILFSQFILIKRFRYLGLTIYPPRKSSDEKSFLVSQIPLGEIVCFDVFPRQS